MPVTLHRRNHSPLMEWDLPACYEHHHCPPTNRRHFLRIRRHFGPCSAHHAHHGHGVSHSFHHHHHHHHHHHKAASRSRQLVIIRRRPSPFSRGTQGDHCDCNRWPWKWLYPCFRTCQHPTRCVERRGRTEEGSHAHYRPPPCYGHEDCDGDEMYNKRGSSRARRAVRVRHHQRRASPSPNHGPGRLYSPPLTPPQPLLRPSRSSCHHCRMTWARRGSGVERTCPSCTGETPDLIDSLCAGVDGIELGSGGGGGSVANAAVASRPQLLPNSPISAPGRLRSRSRRPYWRRGLNGVDKDGDGDGPFSGLLDSASDVSRDEVLVLADGENRGRRKRRGRGSGLRGGGSREVQEESSDFEAWRDGFGGRRAW